MRIVGRGGQYDQARRIQVAGAHARACIVTQLPKRQSISTRSRPQTLIILL